MKAPRPTLLVLGALSLGGVVVFHNARTANAGSPMTDTAVDATKAKDGGGGWVQLGGKDGGGGWVQLGGKDGGSIELASKEDGGK